MLPNNDFCSYRVHFFAGPTIFALVEFALKDVQGTRTHAATFRLVEGKWKQYTLPLNDYILRKGNHTTEGFSAVMQL